MVTPASLPVAVDSPQKQSLNLDRCAVTLDRMGDRASCAIRGPIHRSEDVDVRLLYLHPARQAHGYPTPFLQMVAVLVRLGELHGHIADVLAEATQREAESKLDVRSQSFCYLDVPRSDLDLHLALLHV
ncbi:MAG: hypothetical protein A2341_13985 [Deltaproteobacteria bacterium RIFOXYB12_FULL_58_9]|nr:MAG: hypothetical protein A2341_13985 [Deltaproteobacteria bacterium RIFOXYB12_FULL_58_9]